MFIESVFEYQMSIPTKYTGDGENISPPLKFAEVHSSTKSLVLYALNIPSLNLPSGSSKQQAEKAIKGHLIDTAELMGTYQRT